jgi:hypothetical protein
MVEGRGYVKAAHVCKLPKDVSKEFEACWRLVVTCPVLAEYIRMHLEVCCELLNLYVSAEL